MKKELTPKAVRIRDRMESLIRQESKQNVPAGNYYEWKNPGGARITVSFLGMRMSWTYVDRGGMKEGWMCYKFSYTRYGLQKLRRLLQR